MKLYQMDIQSAFLNGLILEEVYVEQPLGFESDTFCHMFSNLTKLCMGSRILLELGMKK